MKRVVITFALLLIAASAGAQQATTEKLSKKEAALRAEAKVSHDAALATALAAVPGATAKEGELEKEKGKLIWSFDLKVAGKKGVEEIWVDAVTGKVINREHESDAAEAKEAKGEVKVKAKSKTPKPVVPKP